jgi:hypothetical protein
MQASEILTFAVSAKGSPKIVYTIFLLDACKEYLHDMRKPEEINIDTATTSLLAFCPDVKTRDELWLNYTNRKTHGCIDPEKKIPTDKPMNPVTASILTIGDFQAYLSEVLEFTEKSYGAF